MTFFDEEYQSLLRLVFPPDAYPDVYDKLLHFNWNNTKHHNESFRQHCVDTACFMEQFCQEKNLLQDTWHGITYARLVGFLHDVGKPFVLRTTKSGHQLYTGHAQVGARLFYLRFQHEIPEPILLTMAIAIDAHMCCLRSDDLSAVTKLQTNAVMHLYFPSLDVLPILECLHKADAMGKNPSITDTKPAYLIEPPVSYRKTNKIVIFLLGPSGSGKSTLARKLASQLASYGSVNHLERDQVLRQFALEGESYQDCRQRIYNDFNLKKEFQKRWTQTLCSDKSQILLVDTVMNYYHLEAWRFPHHLRIGLYCFPMNFIDASLHGKAPKFEFPPVMWSGNPSVLTEIERHYSRLEVGTGVWQVIPTLVKRYLDQCVPVPLEIQPTIASLWNHQYGSDAITAQYNEFGITFKEQYSFSDNQIIRVSYKTDVIYGPTRYYRGEYLLKTGEGVSMLRSGLPTFRRDMEINDNFQKIVVTPKYDGSLVNILYVPKQYKHYELLKEQFPEVYYPNYGLLFVGSKQTLVMQPFLRKRFEVAIEMDFEAFIGQYDQYLKDKILTLHFEMMVEMNTEELTVYYPHNFCKFIGCTTFTDTTRSFSLPEPTDPRAVEQYVFYTLSDCEKYVEEQHQKLLQGDMLCEPEGFVLYVYDNGVLTDIIKRKFLEYLVAHKPESHPQEYQDLLSNPLLINRFQKCRELTNVCFNMNPLTEDLNQSLTENVLCTRKTFSLYMQENREKLDNWQKQLDEVTNKLRMSKINIVHEFWRYFPQKELMITKLYEPFKAFLE